MFYCINKILLSANTNLRFWLRRPHLGNDLHTSTHAKLSSYPVTTSVFSLLCRRRHLSLLHAMGHVLVYMFYFLGVPLGYATK
jgi:hypothetical protein